jgi:hypothetical protein
MAGRPSDYRPEYVEQAERMCKYLGATTDDLAHVFGVASSTLKEWMNKHPEFRAAVVAGKMDADTQVAERLYQRATGYSHPDVDIKVVDGCIVETQLTKHYAPDTVACIFWLTNRQRALWRRKPTEESHADLDRAIKELDRAKKELEVEALKKGSVEAPPVTKIEIEVVGANARASSQNTDD